MRLHYLFWMYVGLSIAIPSCAQSVKKDISKADLQEVLKKYQEDIRFEQNDGQFQQKEVLYQALTPQASWQFLEDRVSVGVKNNASNNQLFWHLIFKNKQAQSCIEGWNRHPTAFHYLQKNNRLSNIYAYKELWYYDIYPNIDLRFYSKGNGLLEYDFVVHPHASTHHIELGIAGVPHCSIADNGELVMHTAIGKLRSGRPYVYQIMEGKEIEIPSCYVITPDQGIAFEVGNYDKNQPLIIDPTTLLASTLYGGYSEGGADSVTDIEVSDDGVYIIGTTPSKEIPITPGVVEPAFVGACTGTVGGRFSRTTISTVAYVARFNHDLTNLDFATYIGSVESDCEDGCQVALIDLEVDNGNIYLLGNVGIEGEIPITANALLPIKPSYNNITASGLIFNTIAKTPFLLKLDETATQLTWGTYWTSPTTDGEYIATVIRDIEVYNNKVHFVGHTAAATYPTTTGAFQDTLIYPIHAESTTLLVPIRGGKSVISGIGIFTVFNEMATALDYSTLLMGNGGAVNAMDLEIDTTTGYAHIGGMTRTPQFYTTPNAFYQFEHFYGTDQACSSGCQDAFLMTIHPLGNDSADVLLSTGIGTGAYEWFQDLSLSGSTAYVLLREVATTSQDQGALPLTGTPFNVSDTTLNGGYVAKINTQTGHLLASTYLGNLVSPKYITVDNYETVYISAQVGPGYQLDLPLDAYRGQMVEGENNTIDNVMIRLDGQLSELIQGTIIGTEQIDVAQPIATHNGAFYTVGRYMSTATIPIIDITPNAAFDEPFDEFDVFIAKFSSISLVMAAGDTICPNQDYTISEVSIRAAQEPYTISWTPHQAAHVNSIVNDNTLAPTLNVSETTTFTLQLTDSLGATVTDTFQLYTLPASTAVDAGSDQYMCSGGEIQIGPHHFDVVGYSWTPTTGLSDPNNGTPIASPMVSTTYTLTYTDCDGNAGTDEVFVGVDVDPATVMDAGINPRPCYGDDGMIGTPELATFTYSWSPTDKLDDPTLAQPTVQNVTAAKSYTLTMTNICTGISATETVLVSLAIEQANAGEDVMGCPDTELTIGNPPNPVYTAYQWSFVDPATPGTIINATSPNSNVNISQDGSWKVVLATSSVKCGVSHDTMTVVIITSTPVANAGVDALLCVDWPDHPRVYKPIQIGTPAAPFFDYEWSPTTGLDDPNVAEPMALPTINTTYSLTVTSQCNGLTDIDEIVITLADHIPTAEAYQDDGIDDGPDEILICPQPWGGDFIGMDGEPYVIYEWTPHTGLHAYLSEYDSLNAPSVTAKPFVTTEYTLTATDTCSGISRTDVVLVVVSGGSCGPTDPHHPAVVPRADAGPEKVIICEGDSVQMGTPAMNNPNIIYEWFPTIDLNDSTIAQPIVEGPTSGRTYTLTVTNTSNGLKSTDQITIVVREMPLASAGPSPLTFSCASDLDKVRLGPAPTATYFEHSDWEPSWEPTIGLDDPFALRPRLVGPDIAEVYTVRVTDKVTGCFSEAFVVLQFDGSFADAGAAVEICSGESIQMGTPALNDTTITEGGCDMEVSYTYQWDPTEGLSNPNIAQPMAQPTETTTYTLTVAKTKTPSTGTCAESSCEQVSDVTVTLTPSTVSLAHAGEDYKDMCPNDPAVLLGLNPDERPAATYEWLPTTGLDDPNSPMPSLDLTTLAVGENQFNLIVTDNATGCASEDSVIIDIQPTDPPTVSVDPVIAGCPEKSVVITRVKIPAGYDFQWTSTDDPNLDFLIPPTSQSPSVLVQATPLTYTLAVFDQCSGAAVTANTTISPTDPPTIDDMGTYNTTCAGSPLPLNGVSTTGATSFTWVPEQAVTNPNIEQPSFIGDKTTTLNLTISNGACEISATVTIEVERAKAKAGPDQASCNGTPISIGTEGAPSLYDYSWSIATGPGPLPATTSTPQINVDPTATTIYVLSAVVKNSVCPAVTDTVVVTIPTGTPTVIAGEDTSKCKTDAPLTIGQFPETGVTYNWSPATGLSSNTLANPNAAPTQTTTYTVSATNECSGESATDEVTITILPEPIANAGADKKGCDGDQFLLGTTDDGFTYRWSPTTGLDNPNSATPTAVLTNNSSAPLSVTYTLTVDNGSGCIASDNITVTIHPLPTLDYDSEILCGGDSSVTLGHDRSILGIDPPYTIAWTPNEYIDDNRIAHPTVSPPKTMNYTVTLMTNKGCRISQDVRVMVDQISLKPIASNACEGEDAQISINNIPGATYLWSGPNGYRSFEQNNTLNTVTASDFGTYYVEVTSRNNCTYLDSVELKDLCITLASCDITIDTITVGDCTYDEQTKENTTTIDVTVSWGTGAPQNESIIVVAGTNMVPIDAPNLSSPQTVQLLVPADGTTNSGVGVYFEQSNSCTTNNTYDAPLPCGTDCDSVIATVTSNSPVCSKDTIQLSVSVGVTYQWSGPNGFTSTEQQAFLAPADSTMAGLYTVTVTDQDDCVANTSVQVAVIHHNEINAENNSPLCAGDTLILTAIGGDSYSWAGPNNFSSNLATISLLDANSDLNGAYTVEITKNGCTFTDTTIVLIYETAPTAVVVTSDTICNESTNGDHFTPLNNLITAGVMDGIWTDDSETGGLIDHVFTYDVNMGAGPFPFTYTLAGSGSGIGDACDDQSYTVIVVVEECLANCYSNRCIPIQVNKVSN